MNIHRTATAWRRASIASFFTILAVFAGITTDAAAQAQWRPSKPIRLIFPYGAGATGEATTRAVIERMQVALGQPIVLESHPGGNEVVAMQVVTRAEKDGHTIGYTSPVLAINAATIKTPYQVSDVAPVSLLAELSFVLALNPGVPASNTAEFIAYAKANPGKLNVASIGTLKFTNAMFAERAGVKITDVPFNGFGPIIQNLLGGQIDAVFAPAGSVLPHGKAGKVRLIAVSGDRRREDLPEAPTLSETLPGFDFASWVCFVVPAGTPAGVVSRLNAETRAALATPEVQKAFASSGFTARGSTPEELATLIRKDVDAYGRAARALGITVQ